VIMPTRFIQFHHSLRSVFVVQSRCNHFSCALQLYR